MTPVDALDAARDLASLVLLGWLLHREAIHRRALSLLMASTPTHALERARRRLESIDLAETVEEDPRTLLDIARGEIAHLHRVMNALMRRDTPSDRAPTLPSMPSVQSPRRFH